MITATKHHSWMKVDDIPVRASALDRNTILGLSSQGSNPWQWMTDGACAIRRAAIVKPPVKVAELLRIPNSSQTNDWDRLLNSMCRNADSRVWVVNHAVYGGQTNWFTKLTSVWVAVWDEANERHLWIDGKRHRLIMKLLGDQRQTVQLFINPDPSKRLPHVVYKDIDGYPVALLMPVVISKDLPSRVKKNEIIK